MRRRDPLDAARITADGPGPRWARAACGAPGVRAYVSHSHLENGLRDAKIVTAEHVDTKLNLADRLTKGLSHAASVGKP